MAADAMQLFGDFAPALRREPLVGDREVHVREHALLPHENAELVADVVERVVLVHHRTADANHVHTRVARERERSTVLISRAGELHNVDRCPACAARENALAVDLDRELTVA